MDQAKIIEIINENQDRAYFVGKADENCVRGIEERLNVSLSISYKWFLKEFGHGGFNGVEVLGSGLSVIPTCVIQTEDWRNFELPHEYVVIENSGSGAIYCLDTSRMSNNECPVIMWTQYDGVIGSIFNNFYEFLFYRFI